LNIDKANRHLMASSAIGLATRSVPSHPSIISAPRPSMGNTVFDANEGPFRYNYEGDIADALMSSEDVKIFIHNVMTEGTVKGFLGSL
jgi:hypothetical protein